MISFPNLLRAALRARRRKRFCAPVARFFFNLEGELWKLHAELAAQTYEPSAYDCFFVYEPKKRLISAAPFRDRVVHHALTGVLEPIFERSFVSDSYACRTGKGTHAAVRRAQHYARRFRYVLKADKGTRTCCAGGCLLAFPSRGRRPRSRVLRGGSFNNQARYVRSAQRNNNQPDNRNNNNGFRVASTLRQTTVSVMPESAGPTRKSRPAERARVQSPGRRPASGWGHPVRPNQKPARRVW
jgi:hypothetical protein